MTFRCLPLKLYAHKWIPFKSPVTLVKVKDQKYSITWVTFKPLEVLPSGTF